MIFGQHLILDFWGVDADFLDDPEAVREALLAAARAGHCTVVADYFHEFSPVGVTGVLVLAESHLSVHTWPEEGYCALDAFTCGEATDMSALRAALVDAFRPREIREWFRVRGAREAPSQGAGMLCARGAPA